MSTRSGKRLHNSPNANIEPEPTSKRDKKTRSKRAVENSDEQEVPRKRQNYVSFPTDKGTLSVNPLFDESQIKPVRTLRRNTLREQNPATEVVETSKKQVRSARRTTKFSETSQSENQVVTITIGKQKGKKNKKKSKKVEQPEVMNKENDVELAIKKKGKKKKNPKSNSLIDQEETSEIRKNDSHVSMDSYHSAAGSPAHNNIISPINESSPKHVDETGALTQNIHNMCKNRKRGSGVKITSNVHTSITMSMEVDEDVITNTDDTDIAAVTESQQSSLKATMPDKYIKLPDTVDYVNLNATFEKEPTSETKKKKRKADVVVENNIDISVLKNTSSTLDGGNTTAEAILNTTFEKDDIVDNVNSKNTAKKKHDKEQNDLSANKTLNSTFEKRRSPRKSVNVSENASPLNGTFDLSPKPLSKQKLDSTFDKESKLDSTFDKTISKSLISSDNTNSSIVTLDKSDEHSKISITDDDSKTENILNTTPLLIESSLEESKLESSKRKTPESKPILKREGTFTKDTHEVSMSPQLTPNKRQTLPAAGCTPYHSSGKGSQKRSILNLTHSIEKPPRRSPLAQPPRAARVAFCSPVNNPAVAALHKTKVIKSNLKGSNKSFVFDESMSSLVPDRSGRKRSFTHTEGEAGRAPKRSRLAPAPLALAPLAPAPLARAPLARAAPAERRKRTESQPTKPSASATPGRTPSRGTTPSKGTPHEPRSEVKATRLPNFAALHARRFERMESLDECQRRRAERARQLLAPAGSVAVLERGSPRVTEAKARDTPPKVTTPIKAATAVKSTSKLPTLDTLQRGYTRFGFKINCDVNPFSVPSKTTEKKAKETKPKRPNGAFKPNVIKPVVIKTQVQPSLAGATSLRREAAKQAIMREKSFTLAEKRKETRNQVRTVIKGVRTNRRFELQMMSRNING